MLPVERKNGGSVRAELFIVSVSRWCILESRQHDVFRQVYQGGLNSWKSQIATPRVGNQFGSLVVCLSYEHAGGQLTVDHRGTFKVYDWGKMQES